MSIKKILVTGASGFVGRALCSELVQHDYIVRGVVRDISRTTGLQCELTSVMDLVDADWSSALDGVDVVVHLAARVHVMRETASDPLSMFRATNVEGSINLARQAAAAGVRRFIFISSVKVNGEHTVTGKPFKEEDTASPEDAYGVSKLEAEQGLFLIAKQTGMEVVIIRPPLVYGLGVKANFLSMMRAVKSGIPLPFGAIHNKRSFVYVGNLVSLILRCIEHPAASNQVFLVSDGEDISTTELLQKCYTALGRKPRLLPIPQNLIEVCAALLGKQDMAKRLCGNLQVDINKAQALLGWAPPISVVEGLKATARGLNEMDRK